MRQTYQLEWASKDLGQESRVALGDVNGDDKINIIAGTTAASGQQSNLYVFQYRGETYHQLARASLGNNDTHWIGCHDIDKDGLDEIIVGCTGGIHIYKMRKGQLVRIAESRELKETVVCIALADIDRDGKYEIIAVVKGKPRIFIFRYDGKLNLIKSEIMKHQVYCVAAGDTDGDGYPEVVVKTHGPRGCILYVLSFKDGNRYEKWSSHIPDADKMFLRVGDFDLDGKHEIVLDCTGSKVRVLRHMGSAYNTFWDSPTHSQSVKDVAIYDIDGDGQKELIVVCLSNVYIYSWKAGKVILEWNQTVPNGAFCVIAGELNQKGYGEIVVGTIYGYIYVFEARRDRHHGKLWVGKVQAIIQDTVTIPDGKPDAARGVEAKAKFSIDEVRVIHDKVIVDGEVTAKILYVAALPTQPVHFFEATFPFLEFIHLCGASPGMQALVYFNVEHISVDVVSPRRVKITILFEMLVKLVPFYYDP
ncbi:MAG TPA: DUF3794 domain-containing protein [Thermoanaerobacterales bacterium]|nr:DUF3794 domain-containing protein [Thermoanaerobacterales bacterium]